MRLSNDKTNLIQRVKNILNFRRPVAWLVVGMVLLCVILVVCFMTNPVNDGYGIETIHTVYEVEHGAGEPDDIIQIEGNIPDIANDMGSMTEQQIEALPEPKNLTEPPALYLTDALSSQYSEFFVQPGTYEWSYQTEEGMSGISACGLHPLEAAENAKIFKIPNYNGIEDAPYIFDYSVKPDYMEIQEYNIEDMGNTDAVTLSEKTISGERFIPLKRDCIYAIKTVWEESKLEERGFYGNAYYTVVTGTKEMVEEETVTIIAHAKEIIDKQNGRILISSDTDDYPGAFYLDISEKVYDIEKVICGERMLIQMKDTGEVDGKLPIYEACFMQEEREVNTLEGVTMYMETYKSTEGEVEICNEYGKELQYGDWYDIQVQQDGNWYSMPLIIDNAAYHDIAYPVQDQTTSVWEVNWSYFYGELPAGKYRIVKDIIDLREPGDYTKYYLAAEFEIK